MPRFKVTGNHTVDGVKPGKYLTVDDIDRARSLAKAGHIEWPPPVKVAEEK